MMWRGIFASTWFTWQRLRPLSAITGEIFNEHRIVPDSYSSSASTYDQRTRSRMHLAFK